MDNIRHSLICIALEWEKKFFVIPQITSAVSEYDAARLLGCDEQSYSNAMKGQTAVTRGHDFVHNGKKYQVKANRPSGKPGSSVTLVGKAKNYEWDYLIWILYDREYNILEAWEFQAAEYKELFHGKKRLSPSDMRKGKLLEVKRAK